MKIAQEIMDKKNGLNIRGKIMRKLFILLLFITSLTNQAFASYETKNGRTTYTVSFPDTYRTYLDEASTELLFKSVLESEIESRIYQTKEKQAQSEAKAEFLGVKE